MERSFTDLAALTAAAPDGRLSAEARTGVALRHRMEFVPPLVDEG